MENFQISIQNRISNLADYTTFQGTISQIYLDCQNLINFVENIGNAIMFLKLNIIHNFVISTQEIIEVIEHLHELYQGNNITKFKSHYLFLGTQISFSNDELIFPKTRSTQIFSHTSNYSK